MFIYSGHVYIFTIWQTSLDPVAGSWSIKRQPITVCQVMSFWARPNFVPTDMLNFSGCIVSFNEACWMFTIPQLIYLFLFTFLLQFCSNFGDTLWGAVETCSFVISSSWCGYHYQPYAPSSGLLFSGFWGSHILLWHMFWFYAQDAYCLARTPGCCTHSSFLCSNVFLNFSKSIHHRKVQEVRIFIWSKSFGIIWDLPLYLFIHNKILVV